MHSWWSPGSRHSRRMRVPEDRVDRDRRKGHIAERSRRLAQSLQGVRVRKTRLSDDHSLAKGRGKGAVYQNVHDVQVKQIVIAAGETTGKVYVPCSRRLRGRAPRKL